MASLAEQLGDEQQVKRFARFLHANIPLREAVQVSKRVNYFRGKKLYEVLLDKTIADKNKPTVASEEEATQVGVALLRAGLIHASVVSDKKKRELRPVNTNTFSEDGYYTWIFEGSKTMRNVLLGLLVFSIAAMCLFPIWPARVKVGIWYVSVTLLIFLFVLFAVRLVVYIVFWCVGYEFWILPNFFDEDLGVMDSFRPLWSFERGQDLKESWIFRTAGFVLLVAFGYWCTQQPTEFDELYASQMDFLSELYDGKLLSDPAMEEEIRDKAIPDFEELKRQVELEEQGIDPEDDLDEELSDSAMDEMLEDEDGPAADDDEEEELDI